MIARWLMRLFVLVSAVACVAGLAYVYARPPQSMLVTRDGIPHFTPPVIDPRTGEGVPVERLVRHYRGERQ
ncbi:MAG: hypothetical protein C0522_05045 [Rhodocyclaceae bacterium]|jgi:hypothetical protein|nr:hypothetical protein [Rhodocyclaceae bacterium]